MMKRLLLFPLLWAALSANLCAQLAKPLPTLHVEGRWLTDQHGNRVVLHGVMDTPNMYFNGWRWGSPWDGSNTNYNATGATRCLAYFEKILTGLEEARCDVFRLHLDPAWTNDPSSSYTYAGSKGQAADASGEADIKKFNPTRLKTFLKSLYWPLAQKAMNHGMYVVVRPPGVCPGNLKVGDYYNQYLMEVWDIFSSNDSVKKYAGQISIELANEPVSLKNAQGQDDPRALHDFFQPIVEKIRANGFTGIIWAPGTGWQANYKSYVAHPIEGENIGYAVHDYCGWYGCSDDNPDPQQKIRHFRQDVPVVDFAPVIITEVDWSPKKPGTGHYNEHGDWVESNYGTWATGSTSKWGKAYRAMLDHFGNISMTLSGTSCLIDVDTLLAKQKVVPAFGGLEEACGKACMDWYADFYQVDYAHPDDEEQSMESLTATSLATAFGQKAEVMVGSGAALQLTATFQDGRQRDVSTLATYENSAPDVVLLGNGLLRGQQEGTAQVIATYTDPLGHELQAQFSVRSTYFPFAAEYISTSLFANGTYNESSHTFRPGQWGQMGWEYPAGVDMSPYKYLVIKLRQAQNCDAHLNIFTQNSIWSDGYESPAFGSKKQIVIDLETAKTKNGAKLNTKDIRIVAFWGNGGGTIVVDDIYLTNNSDYSPSGIETLSSPASPGCWYDLQGRRLPGRPAKSGFYLKDGRKVIIH